MGKCMQALYQIHWGNLKKKYFLFKILEVQFPLQVWTSLQIQN